MTGMKTNRRIVAACAWAVAAFLAPMAVLAPAPAASASLQPAGEGTSSDRLILRSGRIIEGQILEETDTRVRFMVVTAGISAPQWFEKADVLKLERGTPAAPAPGEAKPAAPEVVKADPKPADGKRVYVINLDGSFGEDITQTPIRDAVRDAKKNSAEYLIFVLNNEWAINQGGIKERLPDDPETAEFDELFRAEEIMPIFMNEIPREWENPPKVIFWVKQAMGGAAFLPFVSPSIYMSSEARWGGIGNLSTLFGSTGDEMVRQKQYSLRMGHAEGWAIAGGYDYRIVKAMARIEYVLSYKLVGGRPMYLERMPEAPDEILLTDDGKDSREDTLVERTRSLGNDVLTLTPDTARKLMISKGTVDRLDDLLYHLGIARSAVRVDGQSSRIMKGWSDSLSGAKRNLVTLMREYGQIQVQGDYNERTRARGSQINKLKEMQQIIRRFGEGLTPLWFARNGFPGQPAADVIAYLETLIEQIRQQQMADRR